MNYQNDITLTDEEFQRIYTDKKFRNCVAYAHTCCDRNAKPISKRAMEYPKSWAVSQEQIDMAKAEIELAKMRTVSEHSNDLILIGMGGVRQAKGEIDNHRARGYFTNNAGRKCFIEVMKGRKSCNSDQWFLMFDFAHFDEGEPSQRTGLAGKVTTDPYTLESVLENVNAAFGCSFKAVFVDNYDLSPDDHVSKAA